MMINIVKSFLLAYEMWRYILQIAQDKIETVFHSMQDFFFFLKTFPRKTNIIDCSRNAIANNFPYLQQDSVDLIVSLGIPSE